MRSISTSRVSSRPAFSISRESSSNSLRRRWTSSPRMKTRWRSTSTWIPPASRTEPPARRGVDRPGVGRPSVSGRGRRRLLDSARGPPQDGPHPGHELPQPVGLGHVVVGPDLEADHGVDLGPLGRHHDDRNRECARIDRHTSMPDSRGSMRSRRTRSGSTSAKRRSASLPSRGHGHVEALAGQSDHQGVDERLVVLGQQHPGLGRNVDRRCRLALGHAVTLAQLPLLATVPRTPGQPCTPADSGGRA